MNSCNARGFLQIGGGDVVALKNLEHSFSKIEGGYIFYINSSFDVFQNAVIKINENVTLNVYLKNDSESYFLGTTDYPIFPNTSFPLSFPFLSFRKRNSYIFIPCENCTYTIDITYDALILKKETLKKLNEKQYPYFTYYVFKPDEIYQYEKDAVHKPIETSIEY